MRHSLCLCDISTPPAETPAAPPTPPSCRPFFDPLIDRSSLFTRVARSQFKCCPPSSFLSASYIMLLGVIMDTCVRHPPSLYLSHQTSWQQLCHTRPRAVLRRHSHTVHSMMNGLISGCGNVPLSLSLSRSPLPSTSTLSSHVYLFSMYRQTPLLRRCVHMFCAIA